MADKQSTGERTYVGIWHSPEAPDQKIRLSDGRYIVFRQGLYRTRDEDEEKVMERVNRGNRYVKGDPKITEPFICQMPGCQTPWYSQSAFTRHTQFKHTGPFRK